jgi:hypothetical protein
MDRRNVPFCGKDGLSGTCCRDSGHCRTGMWRGSGEADTVIGASDVDSSCGAWLAVPTLREQGKPPVLRLVGGAHQDRAVIKWLGSNSVLVYPPANRAIGVLSPSTNTRSLVMGLRYDLTFRLS